MVYTERTDRLIEPTKQCTTKSPDSSPSKYAMPQRSTSSSSTSSYSNWERKHLPSSADKWKYNNMVQNDREKFNSLHFC